MAQRQQTGQEPHPSETAGGMLSMAVLMMAMCVGMVVAISIASTVGGPIAWSLAVLAIAGLAFAHMKFMSHGGH